MRITKVYTKTGDEGLTSLATGDRVSKASLRVSAYGDVDELNSLLGVALTHITEPEYERLLHRLQDILFVVGADLATPFPAEGTGKSDPIRRIAAKEIEALEQAIDRYNEELPPLEEFILPGGSEAGAWLHLARAVARRAERVAVLAAQSEKINRQAVIYLNRLSDLLFVLARVVNRKAGVPETPAQFH